MVSLAEDQWKERHLLFGTGVCGCAVLYDVEDHREILLVGDLDPAVLVRVVSPEDVS